MSKDLQEVRKVSPIGIWGRAFEGRGSGGYQGPKVGVCLRSEEEAGMAEDSEAFEMSARRRRGEHLGPCRSLW